MYDDDVSVLDVTVVGKRAWLITAFLVPFILYLWSLDSDIGFWDTGEMNTVPYILGLAHPTGYPTEILIGWLFSHTVVIYDPAFRLSLLNAIEIALSSMLVYLFARLEQSSKAVALFAALAFASTPVVWSIASHTDVMSLTVLFVSATFLLVRCWQRTRIDGFLYAAAFSGGLASGTHGAGIFYLACPLIAIMVCRRKPALKVAAFASALLLVTCGAVYSYMPLRASVVVDQRLDPTMSLGFGPGMPFWDWGDPRSLSKFTRVVMGEYAGAPRTASSAIQLKQVWPDVRYAWNALANGMGLFYLVLVLGLCTFLCLRDWRMALLLIGPTITVTPFIASFAAESSPGRYYILPIWGLWVAAALALSRADVYVASRRPLRNLMILSAIALVAFAIISNRQLFAQRQDTLARNYVRNVLNATPNGAILIAPWTYATPIAYGAYVSNVVGRRILVAVNINDVTADILRWLPTYSVYAISEHSPASRSFSADYICNFGISANVEQDLKLFRLQRLELSGKDVVAVRVRDMPTLCRAQGLAREH